MAIHSTPSGNTPSAVGLPFAGLNYLTSSDLLEMHAKAKIDIDPKVFGRYGQERLGIMPFIEEFGQTEATSSNEFGHYEQDFTRELIAVQAGYTTASDSTTFTLTTATDFEYPTTVTESWYDAYDSVTTGIPRVGDVIVGGSGAGTELIVTAVTRGGAGGTVTFDATTTDGQNVAAGLDSVEIFIAGRAREERSTGPDGKDVRLIKYNNYVQTIDEAYKVSGTAMGQSGMVSGFGGTDKWYATGIFNTRTNFDAMCELTLLTGSKLSSSSIQNTFKTEGIIPFIENYGNVIDYGVGATAFTLEDLDEMIGQLKKFYGADEYLSLESHQVNVSLDNDLRDNQVSAGGVVYNQKLLDLGFGAIRRSGMNIYRKSLQAFSDPRTLGSADSKYKGMALMIPTGTATAFDYNGGQMVEKPSMVMRYLDVDGEDMGYKEWVTGGAGIASTNNVDEMVITMRKRIGLELYGANLFGLYRNQA
jgi:hypothetical protein